MLTPQSRLRPREEEVAARIMDGEAVIIQITTGVYYSTDKAGALVWALVEAGHSLEEIATVVCRCCGAPPEQVRSDVKRLAQMLLEEDLVDLADGNAPRSEVDLEPWRSMPYEAPQLNIYRDMQDLLALDPPMPRLGDMPRGR